MDRRDFVKTMLASTGAVMIGSEFACQISSDRPDIFPVGTRPESLVALKIPAGTNWHQKISLACFQGLINRQKTRVYLDSFVQDEFWLQHYADESGIPHEILTDISKFVDRFKSEISGCIVYDPEMPHSINLANTLGALQNAVPVSKTEADTGPWSALKKLDDLSGKWKNMYEAYAWALINLQPQCSQKLFAQICVHYPQWPISSWANRDYVSAHKIMAVDISSSERDKQDYRLLRKFYEAYPEETVIIGWHCARDKEHEAIALSSEYGHYGMCSLHTSNLTVHSNILPAERKAYHQRKIVKNQLKVENKVYIAYMATDGDAAWFVQKLIQTDWVSPVRGKFKYNWGFLPMAYDLMPSMVDYYMTRIQKTDYFVAGPAGATYTYPHLHPQPQKFLRLSQWYMKKCGLTTIHMTNWNDRDWWQEVDLPEFASLLRQTMPDCVGYVRGMGESAFEPHYIKGGQPYIFCGEGLHRGDDIYQVIKGFIDACPNRPLFIYNLVNHSIPMEAIKAAMDRFPDEQVEVVHLDELLLLIEKAYEEGKISEELYPEKSGLKKLLARDARQAWTGFFKELIKFQSTYKDGDASYTDHILRTPIGLEEIAAADFLEFATIWHAMTLVKLSLASKEIYVNYKPLATSLFLDEFKDYIDCQVVNELQNHWNSWHLTTFAYDQARKSADRLVNLAKDLAYNHFNN